MFKSRCLLCFNSSSSSQSFSVVKSEGEDSLGKLDTTTGALRVLLRYLNVDLIKLSHFSSSLNQLSTGDGGGSTEGVNVPSTLCTQCLPLITHFSQLFQEFEHIRLQLDVCVRRLHEVMEEAGVKVKAKERGLECRKQLKGGHPGELIHANIAEQLRGEILQKCSLKLRSIPRIVLNKCDKTEDFRSNSNEKHNVQILKRDSIPVSVTPDAKDQDEVSRPLRSRVINKSQKWIVNCTKNGIKGNKHCHWNWMCDLCERKFNSKVIFKRHLKLDHTLQFFSGQIPDDVSEQQLEAAIAFFVEQGKPHKHLDDPSTSMRIYGQSWCPICQVECRRLYLLRNHLLDSHLERVIQQIKGLASDTQPIIPPPCISQSRSVPKKNEPQDAAPNNAESRLLKFFTFEKCEGSSSSGGLGLWKCLLCGNGYNSQFRVKDHLMASHPTKYFSNRIPPSISERDLRKTIAFFVNKGRTSVARKDGRRRRRCCFCKKLLISEWALKMHMLRLHFDEIIEEVGSPDMANLNTSTPTPLRPSIYQIKRRREKTRRMFRNKSKTKAAESVDGKFEIVGDKWKCLKCGKLLSRNMWNFRQHYNLLHTDQSQPHNCFQCGKVFTNLRSLDTHRLYSHVMDYFSEVIPPSVSEHHLEQTLSNFIEKCQESGWISDECKALVKCSLCEKALQHNDTNLRIHFLRLHWSEIIEQSEQEAKTGEMSEVSGVQDQSNGKNKSTPSLAGYAHRRLHQLHKRAVGSAVVTNKCEHCTRTFTQYNFLRNHIMTVHPLKFFGHRIPESVSRADLEQALAAMSRRLTEPEPRHGHSLECSVCKRGFGVGRQVRMHLLRVHFRKVMDNAVRIQHPSPSGCEKSAVVKSESSPVVDFVVEYGGGGCKTEPEPNPTPCITHVESLAVSEIKVKTEKKDVDDYHDPVDVDVSRAHEITIEDHFPVKVDVHQLVEVDIESGNIEETRRSNKIPLKIPMSRGKEQCRCPICGKILFNSTVRSKHLRDAHHLRQIKNPKTGHAVPAPRKCDYCDNVSSFVANMLLHSLIVHPVELLSDQLPSGVTKSQLNSAVESILTGMRYVPDPKDGSKRIFECPLCKRHEVERSRLRAHILDKHIETVVEKVDTTTPCHPPKLHPYKTVLCSYCDKLFVPKGNGLRKHTMSVHPTILFKDRLPPGTSDGDFARAVGIVTAKIKVLQKEHHEPRAFAECTICSKRMRSHSNEMKAHVIRNHFEEVFENVERIHEGLSVSPEYILPCDITTGVVGDGEDDEVQLGAEDVNMGEENDPLSISF